MGLESRMAIALESRMAENQEYKVKNEQYKVELEEKAILLENKLRSANLEKIEQD